MFLPFFPSQNLLWICRSKGIFSSLEKRLRFLLLFSHSTTTAATVMFSVLSFFCSEFRANVRSNSFFSTLYICTCVLYWIYVGLKRKLS